MNLKIKRMRELAGFFAQTVRTDGFGPTLKRSAAFLKRRFGSKKGRFLPKKETLAAQRALDYGALGWPAVSICVPLYNTPQKYLRQLLDSVLGQTCPNWQLCLADASDAAHGDVAQTVRAYQARDARIVYTKVENKGISANTNAAAALAAGEYLALTDHDDVGNIFGFRSNFPHNAGDKSIGRNGNGDTGLHDSEYFTTFVFR